MHDGEPYDDVGWTSQFEVPQLNASGNQARLRLVADLMSIGRRNGNIFDLKDREFAGRRAPPDGLSRARS